MVVSSLRFREASTEHAAAGWPCLGLLAWVTGFVALSALLASARPASAEVSVGRANTDGTLVINVLINRAGPGTPGDIAVGGDHLYWLAGDAIARAELDGSDVELDFITGLGSVSGLTATTEHLYWGGSSIGRARLDGTDVEPGFMTPSGVAHDVAAGGQYLYWTSDVGIGRANLDGADATPAFIDTGVHEATPLATEAVLAPTELAVNGTRVFWVYSYGAYGGDRSAVGRASLDGGGAEYPIMSRSFWPHPSVFGPLGADDSRVFFRSSFWDPHYLDDEISSFDANFASGSAPSCCSPSWPSIGDPNLGEGLSGGVTVDRGHVYWAHEADRELHCGPGTEELNQQQTGRKIRFMVWFRDCERLSVHASGRAEIAGRSYKLKRKTAVIDPPVAPVSLKPKRKDRHEILAALEDGHAAYARMRVEIADASGNSRTDTYQVRLSRR